MTTFRTEFRDPELMTAALTSAEATYEVNEPHVEVSSPVLLRIGLATGNVTAADGPEAHAFIRQLQQLYAEAKYKSELTRRGGHVEGRTVDKDGNIVLMCAFAEESPGS